MAEAVKIQIILVDGSVSIEAPTESLETIFDRLELFLPKLIDTKASYINHDNQQDKHGNLTDEDENIEETDKASEATITKPNKKKRNSSAKGESYKPVDLKLSEKEREAFREFYLTKKPQNQSEHILVVMYWLLNQTDRKILSKEDIFTGLKTVNERIPKRISSVLSNLTIDGKVVAEAAGKYTLHHTGDDFVNHDMPQKKIVSDK